jgi:beta-lactamase superfamily II metal-dependent hydrolase
MRHRADDAHVRRWTGIAVVLLVVLTVSAGCVGESDRDRSVETFELTVSTPPSQTADLEAVPERNVTFLGLAEGQSSLVVGPGGSAIVVDAGADPNASRILTALNASGVDYYDLWLTGFNRSRIGGAATLVRRRPPANVGFSGLTAPGEDYDQFLRAAVESDRQRALFGELNGFAYGHAGGLVDVLAPPRDYLADRAPAHNELVISYTAADTRVVWLGDPGRQEERWLLEEHDGSLEADVAVLAAGATPSAELLAALDPSIVVVQGTQHANRTVEAVRGADAEVYRPAREGAVTLRIGANDLGVRSANRTPR